MISLNNESIQPGKYSVLFQVLFIHGVVSLLFLMAYDMGHPLSALLEGRSLWIQVIAVSVFVAVFYSLGGFLLVVSKVDKEVFFRVIPFALISLSVLLLLFYLVYYGYSLLIPSRINWLFYSIINPLFGTYMYALPQAQLFSLVWIVSCFVPSLALCAGIVLAMKHKEIEE